MVHIIYGLMCRKNFVRDEVCRVIKKFEKHWYKTILFL
jgi:hypothetical protein